MRVLKNILDSLEAWASLAVIVLVVALGFSGLMPKFLYLSVSNTGLHIGLVVFGLLAPRIGGLICGGIESALWGQYFAQLIFHDDRVAFIVPVFFIGTIGTLLLFILVKKVILRVFVRTERKE